MSKPVHLDQSELDELRRYFQDVINYESDDPTEQIHPLNYAAPDGDTCMHKAAQRGQLRPLELLTKGGADINAIGDMGNTPLHYAWVFSKKTGTKDVLNFLLDHGADKTIRNEFGKLPLE